MIPIISCNRSLPVQTPIITDDVQRSQGALLRATYSLRRRQ